MTNAGKKSRSSGGWRPVDREARRRAEGDARRARLERQSYDPTAPAPHEWVAPEGPEVRRVREPRSLGDMLGSFVSTRSWTSRLRQADVLNRWPEVVGASIAQHSRPVKLQGDVLVVAVDTSAWATQLKYLTPTMRDQVNAAFGGEVVSRIHLVVDPG